MFLAARTLAFSLVPAALTLFAAGCGDGKGGAPASCLQVQPCGGDLVGTWRLLGGCVNTDALAAAATAACPAFKIGADLDASGTLTFDASLSYSVDVAETIAISQSIPLECTMFASCADVQADMEASITDSVVACSGTTTCACTTTATVPRMTLTGTYTASGTTVVLTQSTGSMNTDGYCVQGNMLHMMQVATDGTIQSDIVAQRQ